MLKTIQSDLPTFKNLNFHSGLNVIVAKKTMNASSRQTRNRAGKSSMIEIIHFLLAAEKPKLFNKAALAEKTFRMDFVIDGMDGYVKRTQGSKTFISSFVNDSGESVQQPDLFGNPSIAKSDTGILEKDYSLPDWSTYLGEQWFELEADKSSALSFRRLINYFIRRPGSNAFTDPLKPVSQDSMYQIALMYLLGLDWRIADDFVSLKAKEKTVKELKNARKEGILAEYVGRTAAELLSEIVIQENKLKKSQKTLAEFKILPEYEALQNRADILTENIRANADEMLILEDRVKEIEFAISGEKQPQIDEIEKIFIEAEQAIPDAIKERYEAVAQFHQSILANRKNYLSDEKLASQKQIYELQQINDKSSEELSEAMRLLKSHGALEQFTHLQSAVNVKEAELLALKKQHELAHQIENLGSTLKIEKAQLEQRLLLELTERNERVSSAILAYEECSSELYESAGTMQIEASNGGIRINFDIQGQGSVGISKMETFCFDMMLMQICGQRGIGPKFLIHDSELFDGVDGRQLVKALQIGAKLAEKYDFQYIVTLNEDDAFKETIEGFDLNQYTVKVDLNDHEEQGGLFGIRF